MRRGINLSVFKQIQKNFLRKHYKDKTALIIGGSEGIGFAIANLLAEFGAKVTITSRDIKKLESAKESIISRNNVENPSNVKIATTDITDSTDVRGIANRYKTELDFLFIMPGITIPGYFEELTMEDHRLMMETNYFAQLAVIDAFLDSYNYEKKMTIVSSSSALGLMGLFGYSGYCASKFAVVGLIMSLQNEYAGSNLTIKTICAPAVKTEGFEKEIHLKTKKMLKAESQAGLLKPSHAALSILFGSIKKKPIIVPGTKMKFIVLINRLFPPVTAWFNDKLSIKNV